MASMINMVNEKLDNEDELNKLLSERYMPQAPEGLAARIIAASHASKVQRKSGARVSIFDHLRGLAAEFGEFFLLPRPAYALATCLIIGALVGFEMQAQIMPGDVDWSSFMSVNEDWI